MPADPVTPPSSPPGATPLAPPDATPDPTPDHPIERPDTPEARTRFVLAQTAPARPPLLPEIELYLASEVTPLWHATEKVLADTGVPPPYWAFAWAGGQALARYILDEPAAVRGLRVLDFATGSGMVAIAAARAGAASVVALDIDPFAGAACALNAARNGVRFDARIEDVLGRVPLPASLGPIDLVLVGDLFYERDIAEALTGWLRALAASGVRVLVGDPGRGYLPHGLRIIWTCDVAVPRDLEGRERCTGWVMEVPAEAGG